MESKAGTGIRWSVFALGCMALAGCGGSNDDEGGAGDAFTTESVPFELTGGEANVDTTDASKVLASGLAVVASVNSFAVLGIADFDDGAIDPQPTIEANCDAGSGTIDVSESGSERTFTLTADQCFLDRTADVLFDGEFTRVTTTSGANIAGTLQAGSGSSPGIFVVQDDSTGGLFSLQLLSAGSGIEFSGSSTGSPFTLDLSGVGLLMGEGGRPSTDGLYLPTKQIEVKLGTGASLEVETHASGTNLVVDSLNGPLTLRGDGLTSACNFSGKVSATTTDLTIDSSGKAIDGTLTLTAGGGPATIEFLADGGANVTPSVGTGTAFTAAEVAALCGF